MGNALKDMLSGNTPDNTPPKRQSAAPEVAQEAPSGNVEGILSHIEWIEVQAVVGGLLQTIHFGRGEYGTTPNPAQIKGAILTLDPGAKVLDDFPRKGFGGPKDLKTTRAMVINVAIKDNFKSIELICQNGDDVSVSVSKRNADEFLPKLITLGKLTDKNLARVKKAFDEKGQAVVVLTEAEQFGVTYADFNGRNYLEDMTAEPPAHVEHAEAEE